jgi:hypothetical protein
MLSILESDKKRKRIVSCQREMQKTPSLIIINPDFTTINNPLMKYKNLIKINNNIYVKYSIKTNKNYIIHLIDSDTILDVKCILKGVCFIDMKITSITQNGQQIDIETCKNIISYKPDNFNIIVFNNIKETCNIYHSLNNIY